MAPPDQVLNSIVAQRFGFKITGKITESVRKAEHQMRLRESLAAVFNHILCEAINHPSHREYAYLQPLVTWLTKRQIPLDLVDRLPIGGMPTKGHIFEHIDPEFRATFEDYLPKNLIGLNPDEIFNFTGSLSFHYQPAPGFAGRIKLRKLDASKSMMWLGSLDEPTGYFGLDLYKACMGRESTANLVEGEFDVLRPYVEDIKRSSVPSVVFIGVSGGAVDDVSSLKDIGFQSGIVVGDNDSGGEGFARMALEKAETFGLKVFDWKRTAFAAQDGADPDTIVCDGQFDAFTEALATPTNLVARHLWVADQIERELANADPTDLELQKNVLTLYARCIHDATDRAVLGDLLRDRNVLSEGIVRSLLRGAASQEEYIDSVERALRQDLIPLMIDGKKVQCYSKPRKSTFEFSAVNSKEMAASIGSALKTSIYEWCASRIGEPNWLLFETVRNQLQPRPYHKRKELVLKLFEDAVEKLYVALPTAATLTWRQQGIHYIDAAAKNWDHSPATRHRVYVVNGSQVFLGYLDATRPRVQWELLEIPKHETLTFKTGPDTWAPGLSITDLNRTLQLTPKEVFESVRRLLALGWTFSLSDQDAQDLEINNIAGLLFYSPIATLFDWMVQTFLHADPSSGKSALLSLFNNSDGQSQIALGECSTNWGEWTASGVTQHMSGRSMLVCLDEFENPRRSDQDEQRKRQVKKILGMLRQNVVTEIKSIRGTPSGEARATTFRAPILAAGVNAFDQSDTAVDLSRWNVIRGYNDPDRFESPEERILAPGNFSLDEINELRRNITLLVLQQAAKIREHYQWCKKEYSSRKDMPKGTNYRLLNIVLPVAAILRWAGQDEEKFLYDYLRHKIRTMAVYYTTGTDTILHDLLSIGRVQLADDPGRPATPGSLLGDPNRRESINATHCGVYYISQLDVVVIHCRQALNKLLRFHPSYRHHSDGQVIRKKLLHNPLAMSEDETKKLNVSTYLQTYMGIKNIPYRDLVAFPLGAVAHVDDGPKRSKK
jgi:hypothetical protein